MKKVASPLNKKVASPCKKGSVLLCRKGVSKLQEISHKLGMNMTSKSPIKVLKEAYEVGKATFDDYSHEYSPRKFTQPQLFACLILKAFFCMDYRGICEVLSDCTDFQKAIELTSVPHFTTLQKHSKELLRLPNARNLLESTLARAKKKDS